MKKSLATLLAATAVLGVTTAFAANPFSDVEPSHWAYQAVAQLASQGVVEGYPDGTFKGERNITRYEMAQMVARAMARQDRVDAEQNAMINRLADEFSDELNSLGVRVSNLENRVGNVKVTGDLRARYTGWADDKKATGLVDDKKAPVKPSDKWDFRARLNFGAKVSDDTSVKVRVSTGNIEFGGKTAEVGIDQIYVTHKFGDQATLTAGRMPLVVGAGLVLDDNVDGAAVSFGKDVKVTAGYVKDLTKKATEKTLVQLQGTLSDVALGGFWLSNAGKDNKDVYGANAAFGLHQFGIDGEWTTTDGVKQSDAWVAGVGFKAGEVGLKVQYLDIDKDAALISPTFDFPAAKNATAWAVTADYQLAKDVTLTAAYSFDRKLKSVEDPRNSKDLADWYQVKVGYKF